MVPAIVVLGDWGIGKTTIINRLLGNEFKKMENFKNGLSSGFLSIEEKYIRVMDNIERVFPSSVTVEFNKHEQIIALFVATPNSNKSYFEKWNSFLKSLIRSQEVRKLIVVNGNEVNNNINYLNSIKEKMKFEAVQVTDPLTDAGINNLKQAINNVVQKLAERDCENEGFYIIIRQMVEKLCRLIAKNATILREIEWRELERIIAETLEELGFYVELTPLAKDGGKDIILQCVIKNEVKKYYVEIKHWKQGCQPGVKHINQFVEVNVRDSTHGGLFLSSGGYTRAIYRHIGKLLFQNIKLGDQEKIISLCQHYIKKRDGVWHSNTTLPELLFENTL